MALSPKKTVAGPAVRIVCAVLTGILLYLAFPPVDLWWLSFVALVPLLLILPTAPSLPKAVLYAGISGIVFYVPATVWLASVTLAGWLMLAVYLALYFCLFAVLARLCAGGRPRTYPFLLPVIWVGLEIVRATVFTGFPWFTYGFTQYRFPPLLQVASVSGAYGLSFLLVFLNASLAELLRGLRRGEEGTGSHTRRCNAFAFALSVACLVFAGIFGRLALDRLPQSMSEGPVVGVVQQNIPPALPPDDIQQIYRMLNRMSDEQIRALSEEEKSRIMERLEDYAAEEDRRARREIDILARHSRELADAGATLIAWPETAVNVPLNPEAGRIITDRRERNRREYALDTIGTLAEQTGSFFLVGAPARTSTGPPRQRTANSAFLFSPAGEIIGRYDKKRLVPFGEYTPGRDLLPAPLSGLLQSLAIAQSQPGDEAVVFDVPLEFAAPICYDNVFSDLMRTFRRRGARVLINISNEGWYHIPGELEQHLAMAVFRAVETRTTVVRATNTGISCFIDPTGTIYGTVRGEKDGRKVRKNVEGSLALPVWLLDQAPPYTYWGDWFAVLCAVMTGAGIGWAAMRKYGEPK